MISGIAGGGYTHRIGYAEFRRHCVDALCILPGSGYVIPIADRYPTDETTFISVEANGRELEVQPYGLRDGQVVPYSRASADLALFDLIE